MASENAFSPRVRVAESGQIDDSSGRNLDVFNASELTVEWHLVRKDSPKAWDIWN